MKNLSPEETILSGSWAKTAEGVRGDDVSRRIEWLTSEVLRPVAVRRDSGGWAVLFEDPADGRRWLREYPQGGFHGGGAATLRAVSLSASDLSRDYVPYQEWVDETERDRRARGIKIVRRPEPPAD